MVNEKNIFVNKDALENEVLELIKNNYPELIIGEIKKVIYVQGKTINIIYK